MAEELPARALRPTIRMMLEAIAAELDDMSVGEARLEAIYRDGNLRLIYVHAERISADELDVRYPRTE